MLALRAYVGEAHKTCKALDVISKFPVSFQTRSELMHQRDVENRAYDRYRIARQHLFSAAEWE